MKYLFDSSAIFNAIKQNKIEKLLQGYKLDLSRYELGNALWKEHLLLKKITKEQLKNLIKIIKDTLNLMQTLKIECHEEKILETASKLNLTFYDASYAYLAKTKNLTLITQDKTLQNKTAPYIKTQKLESITS
jgi:predicted nucleic acid-binding protein